MKSNFKLSLVIAAVVVATVLACLSVSAAGRRWIPPQPQAPPSGPTLLLDEDAEGTGTPSGWTNINTVDWDNTTVVLEGTESLYIPGQSGGGRAHYDFGSAYGTLYVRFAFRPVSAENIRVLSFRTQSGDSEIAWVSISGGNTFGIQHGSTSAFTVATVSPNTNYVVEVRYTAGSGSNGVMSLAFGADEDLPTSGDNFVTLSTGTATASCNRVQFRNGNTGANDHVWFDSMRVAEETMQP